MAGQRDIPLALRTPFHPDSRCVPGPPSPPRSASGPAEWVVCVCGGGGGGRPPASFSRPTSRPITSGASAFAQLQGSKPSEAVAGTTCLGQRQSPERLKSRLKSPSKVARTRRRGYGACVLPGRAASSTLRARFRTTTTNTYTVPAPRPTGPLRCRLRPSPSQWVGPRRLLRAASVRESWRSRVHWRSPGCSGVEMAVAFRRSCGVRRVGGAGGCLGPNEMLSRGGGNLEREGANFGLFDPGLPPHPRAISDSELGFRLAAFPHHCGSEIIQKSFRGSSLHLPFTF